MFRETTLWSLDADTMFHICDLFVGYESPRPQSYAKCLLLLVNCMMPGPQVSPSSRCSSC